MNSSDLTTDTGYYLVTIRPTAQGYLLNSNNERAFIVSCLQDSLTNRGLLDNSGIKAQLATHIDLLAFSILKEGIQFIAFSIASNSIKLLADSIVSRLTQYQSDNSSVFSKLHSRRSPSILVRQLIGPHEALSVSTQLHLNHTDWEYDRYSSIGFYLHDRRGDWVRLWRLSHLYENKIENYYRLLAITEEKNSPHSSVNFTYQQFATSKHA